MLELTDTEKNVINDLRKHYWAWPNTSAQRLVITACEKALMEGIDSPQARQSIRLVSSLCGHEVPQNREADFNDLLAAVGLVRWGQMRPVERPITPSLLDRLRSVLRERASGVQPGAQLDYEDLVRAIEKADWTGFSIGRKAIVQAGLMALAHGDTLDTLFSSAPSTTSREIAQAFETLDWGKNKAIVQAFAKCLRAMEKPEQDLPPLKEYTVTGVWYDTMEPFVQHVQAIDASHAQDLAIQALASDEEPGANVITGVFEGTHQALDACAPEAPRRSRDGEH